MNFEPEIRDDVVYVEDPDDFAALWAIRIRDARTIKISKTIYAASPQVVHRSVVNLLDHGIPVKRVETVPVERKVLEAARDALQEALNR